MGPAVRCPPIAFSSCLVHLKEKSDCASSSLHIGNQKSPMPMYARDFTVAIRYGHKCERHNNVPTQQHRRTGVAQEQELTFARPGAKFARENSKPSPYCVRASIDLPDSDDDAPRLRRLCTTA